MAECDRNPEVDEQGHNVLQKALNRKEKNLGQERRSPGFGKLSERGADDIKGAQNGYKCALHARCVNYILHYPETRFETREGILIG